MRIRDLPSVAGVYVIENTQIKSYYVGSSSNVRQRVSAHRKQLEAHKHRNTILQRDWSQYGQHAFKVMVLEHCDVIQLVEREQHWIDRLVQSGKGCYNRALRAARTTRAPVGGQKLCSVAVVRNAYSGASIVVPFFDGISDHGDILHRIQSGFVQNKEFNRDKRNREYMLCIDKCVACASSKLQETVKRIEQELIALDIPLYPTPAIPKHFIRKHEA